MRLLWNHMRWLGSILVLVGAVLIIWRKRLGAMGLKGRWKDFRLFDDGKPIERSDRWWVWVLAGSLLMAAVIVFMIARGSAVGGIFLALLPALLIRTGFDKKRGGRPEDPAWTNALVLGFLGLFLFGLGLFSFFS